MKRTLKNLLFHCHVTNRVGLVIAGVQKAATTSLHHALKNHSHVFTASKKEVAFWNFSNSSKAKELDYNPARYNQLFPTIVGNRKILMDSTPYYVLDKGIPQRVINYNPECKFIINLRNPVDRLLSAYRMCSENYAKQEKQIQEMRVEKRKLADIIDYEISVLKHGNQIDNSLHPQYRLPYYIPQSLYASNIERFSSETPRENLLVNIIEEDIYPDNTSFMQKVQQFLGIPEEPLQLNALNKTNKTTNHTYPELFQIFESDILALETTINRSLDCWRP